MKWIVRWKGIDGQSLNNIQGEKEFDTETQARTYARLKEEQYQGRGLIRVAVIQVGKLTDVEFYVRKVRGQDAYYIAVRNDDIQFATESEKLVFKHVLEHYVGGEPVENKEEVEQKLKELKQKITTIYKSPIKTDLERLTEDIIQNADITTSRKTALNMLKDKMAKLPYYSDLIDAIADEFLRRKWYANVIRSL